MKKTKLKYIIIAFGVLFLYLFSVSATCNRSTPNKTSAFHTSGNLCQLNAVNRITQKSDIVKDKNIKAETLSLKATDDKTQKSETDETVNGILEEQYNQFGLDKLMDELPNQTKEGLKNAQIESPSPEDMQKISVWELIKSIFNQTFKLLKTPITVLSGCMAVLVLAALFETFADNTSLGMSSVLGTVASLAIAGIVIEPLLECIKYAASSIKAFSDFMLCFIPAFTGVVAASGGTASAVGYNSAVFILAEIISSVTANILLPFIGVFLALSVVGSVSPQFKISGITKVIKKTVVVTLSFLTAIFLGLFSAQNIVAVSADNLSVKTAKLFSGSFVPVVGSALSDSLSSVLACIGLIKSAVGSFSVIVCIITFVPPVLTILFFLLTTNITGACADFFGLTSIEGITSASKDALSILLAFIVSVAVIIIISTAIMLKLGGV